MILEFTVIGIAQQMGSKSAFLPRGSRYPVITDANKNLRRWQQLVMEATHTAILGLPPAQRVVLREGVRLTVAFYLRRPKSLRNRMTAHITTPDLDKIVRAFGDALTGVVFVDDSQIVDLIAMKRYAAPGEVPRVDVRVEPSAGTERLTLPMLPLFTMEQGA